MTGNLPIDGSAAKKIKVSASCFMGLAHVIYLKNYIKGLLFALVEFIFIAFIPTIVLKLINLVTLGDPQPNIPIKQRDNSMFMLIDGVLVLAIIAIFVVAYILSVKSAQKDYKEYCRKKAFSVQKENLKKTLGSAFPIAGLAPGFILILVFVVVPLVFSVCVAFTNYSSPHHLPPNNTVDWVGMDNFKALLTGDTSWSQGFSRVAIWTLIWAIAATVTC